MLVFFSLKKRHPLCNVSSLSLRYLISSTDQGQKATLFLLNKKLACRSPHGKHCPLAKTRQTVHVFNFSNFKASKRRKQLSSSTFQTLLEECTSLTFDNRALINPLKIMPTLISCTCSCIVNAAFSRQSPQSKVPGTYSFLKADHVFLYHHTRLFNAVEQVGLILCRLITRQQCIFRSREKTQR